MDFNQFAVLLGLVCVIMQFVVIASEMVADLETDIVEIVYYCCSAIIIILSLVGLVLERNHPPIRNLYSGCLIAIALATFLFYDRENLVTHFKEVVDSETTELPGKQ